MTGELFFQNVKLEVGASFRTVKQRTLLYNPLHLKTWFIFFSKYGQKWILCEFSVDFLKNNAIETESFNFL